MKIQGMSTKGCESGKSLVYQGGYRIDHDHANVMFMYGRSKTKEIYWLLCWVPSLLMGAELEQSRLLFKRRGGALGCCCPSTVHGDFSGDFEETKGERGRVGGWIPAVAGHGILPIGGNDTPIGSRSSN